MSQNSSQGVTKTIVASFCVMSFGNAGAGVDSSSAPPSAVVLESGATQGADSVKGVEYRGVLPTLLANPIIRGAALRLEAQLAEFLGAGHGIRFVFEEVVTPDDPAHEPVLYAIALLPNEESDALLDKFIFDEWSSQPVEVRRAVCIGREFV